MRRSTFLNMIWLVALVALASCGKRQVVKPGVVLPPECEISVGSSRDVDTITVALFDEVDPQRAPRPGNPGEKLLFHHLYETLITIDCLGMVHPGLAGAWVGENGGRLWIFKLRESARFWDGSPVTAYDVERSLHRAANRVIKQSAGIDSFSVVGEDVVGIYFRRAYLDVPRVLSCSEFAIAGRDTGSIWPLGSGPYEIARSSLRPSGNSKQTIWIRPAFGGKGPVIRFLETSKYKTRDMLEGVTDVTLTGDPDVVEYAKSLRGLSAVSLAWYGTYVLLSTSRIEEIKSGGKPGMISLRLSEELARDAVRQDARGHRFPSWWDDLGKCGSLSNGIWWLPPAPRGAYSSGGVRRVLYDERDNVSRDLAERIVALAVADSSASWEAAVISSAVPGLRNDAGIVAEGVTAKELDESLLDGDDFAYVVPISSRPADRCFEARKLLNKARWLAGLGVDFKEALIPLVDARLHVITDTDRVGLAVDWNGDLLIVNGIER